MSHNAGTAEGRDPKKGVGAWTSKENQDTGKDMFFRMTAVLFHGCPPGVFLLHQGDAFEHAQQERHTCSLIRYATSRWHRLVCTIPVKGKEKKKQQEKELEVSVFPIASCINA